MAIVSNYSCRRFPKIAARATTISKAEKRARDILTPIKEAFGGGPRSRTSLLLSVGPALLFQLPARCLSFHGSTPVKVAADPRRRRSVGSRG
ncbi:hypothetical protein BRADI_5g03761v3 [Brachypodium distachyon]|uniref:Uncharacterized protein n=1 Tax=Brachypodium distachyon TaxID=15368 RepID=A0A2K2CFD3_BRADI|nr:hypothetical protein BRADI_5g03761v3 [Brachypodium distachyon]PNT60735.1 hypothetical protein BRADI_5g03761v3 [Brachypodium distachyon]PNT60736.1 hypothetical protein BRADI_5g03761v3 [Brachypodium distachyon]PNT60737.1 hypothetical protein BRADI_5g03761v3 [Brachypodium distachyon]PNT60738.1 hypothetical protein BRADI_5g03761v3 [Brachypodium distachyon]